FDLIAPWKNFVPGLRNLSEHLLSFLSASERLKRPDTTFLVLPWRTVDDRGFCFSHDAHFGRELEPGGHVRSALRRSHAACDGNSLLERTTSGRLHGCVDLPGPVWSRSGGDGNTPTRDQSERDARNSGRGHPHLLSGLRRLWDGSRRTRPRTRWICNWGNGHARHFLRRPVHRRGTESRPRFWTSSGLMVLA